MTGSIGPPDPPRRRRLSRVAAPAEAAGSQWPQRQRRRPSLKGRSAGGGGRLSRVAAPTEASGNAPVRGGARSAIDPFRRSRRGARGFQAPAVRGTRRRSDAGADAVAVLEPAVGPALQLGQRRLQLSAHLGEFVLDAQGRTGINRALHDAPTLQFFHPLR
jgi:hypothetical protein